jgi:hypothetical protein
MLTRGKSKPEVNKKPVMSQEREQYLYLNDSAKLQVVGVGVGHGDVGLSFFYFLHTTRHHFLFQVFFFQKWLLL